MKNINKNIETEKMELRNVVMNFINLKIRRNIMKTRILISGLAIALFLLSFSGCSLLKKAETKSSFAGRQINPENINNSGIDSEEVIYNYSENQSQGLNTKYAGNFNNNAAEELNSGNTTLYEDEEILNENPLPLNEEAGLDEFENKLSSDGDFINVNEEEVDPDNNISSETVRCDVDVYTNVIWVPKIKYVYAGWNPYTNGRWVWTRYGWVWKSYYHWGWATYHYGRWWYSHKYGWVWSPGKRWAPAWVVWKHHRHYTGWHPISPRVRRHNGVISPIMPRINSGWVIVKKEDFTKKINTSVIITGTKKNEIIKTTDPVITLKKDGNVMTNKNVLITKTDLQTKKTDTKKINYVNTASDNDNKMKNKNNLASTKHNNVKNEKKTESSETKMIEKNTQKKKDNNTVKTVNSVTANDTQKKPVDITSRKENNSVSSNNTTKKETKSVVKEDKKKTQEKKNYSVENNNSNNSTNKTNNNTVTKKTENTNRTSEKVVTKTETKNNFVKESPKVEQKQKIEHAPKVEQKQKIEQAPKVEQKQKTNKEKAPETNKNNGTKKGD